MWTTATKPYPESVEYILRNHAPIFCRFVLIFCSHLQLFLPNDFLLSCFAANILCVLLISVARVATRAQLTIIDFNIVIIFDEIINIETVIM
jgi:hypothetical protein